MQINSLNYLLTD